MGICARRCSTTSLRSIAIVAGIVASLADSGSAHAQNPAAPAPAPAQASIEVMGTVGAIFTRGLGPPDPVLRFGVRNVTDRDLLLGPPVLCSMGLGDAPLAVGSPGLSASTMREVLPPMAVREVSLSITGIESSGKYKGRVCFPGGKSASGVALGKLDVDFSLVVKDSGWYAIAAIAAGVLASEVVRAFLSRGRRRLVQRIDTKRFAAVLAELRKRMRDPGVLDVLGALDRQIEKLESDIVHRVEPPPDAALEALAVKVPLAEAWADLRVSILRLDPGEKREELLSKLNDAETRIRNPRATKADLETTLQSLQTVSVKQAERETYRAAVAELDATIQQPGFAEIQTTDEMKAIRVIATSAKAALHNDLLLEVDRLVREARAALAPLLVNALLAVLENKSPPGFTDPDWKRLRDELLPRLDPLPEEGYAALARYRECYARYAIEVAAALARELEGKRSSLPQGAEGDADRARIEAAKKGLLDLQAGTSMRDAPAALRGALELLEQIAPPTGTRESLISGGGARDMLPPSGALSDMALPPVSAARSAEELTGALRSWDGAVAGTLFIVSVLSGLRVLWATPDVWGTPADYLGAVLWGFAVQSMGNAPFEGIGAIRDRLLKMVS